MSILKNLGEVFKPVLDVPFLKAFRQGFKPKNYQKETAENLAEIVKLMQKEKD